MNIKRTGGGGSCHDYRRCVGFAFLIIYAAVALAFCVSLLRSSIFTHDDDRHRRRDTSYNRTQPSGLGDSTGESSRPRRRFRDDLCLRLLDRYVWRALLPAIFWPVLAVVFVVFAIWMYADEKRKDTRKSGRPLYCCGILLRRGASDKTNKTKTWRGVGGGRGDAAGSLASQSGVEMTGWVPPRTQLRAEGSPLAEPPPTYNQAQRSVMYTRNK